MPKITRRELLKTASFSSVVFMLPETIQKALAIPAHYRTGTIDDVEHVVILMQENRSFDHYFGTFPGIRGFSDRFTTPLPNGRTIWQQQAHDRELLPYHLNSHKGNAQRVQGTPHTWKDMQSAWDHGRMTAWPTYKTNYSMGYYREHEIPFHYALANAFTLCDAYHCSMLTGTNPNRLFLWTGSNGASAADVAIVINEFDSAGPAEYGLQWKTYPERLEEQGISWKVYQYLPDNFGDNPLEGFRQFRAASIQAGNPAEPAENFTDFVPYTDELNTQIPLYKGNGNTLPSPGKVDLQAIVAGFKADIKQNKLPQVSWIVAPAAYSEHPGPSSPIQGGWFTQEILSALVDVPEVWSKTVLFVNYDENDGFFDHMPTPATPSLQPDGTFAGKSTVAFNDEMFSHVPPPYSTKQPAMDNRPYGPGPRVPLFVLSPWSRGGWVNSQIFDHTSILQFLERRFHVREPNISAWRRAICGDLTSAFNFANPNHEAPPKLPKISQHIADQIRAKQEKQKQVPFPTINEQKLPFQRRMLRPSRALPYQLAVDENLHIEKGKLELHFINTGTQGAVFHLYDKLHLDKIPRRYTVEAGKAVTDEWDIAENYNFWILGPNGFHRELKGSRQQASPTLSFRSSGHLLTLIFSNPTDQVMHATINQCEYTHLGPWQITIPAHGINSRLFNTQDSAGWYDLSMTTGDAWFRRVAGRLENGTHSVSDPLMGVI